jgi:formylglycine-generating enzyme required for sulfatase activity
LNAVRRETVLVVREALGERGFTLDDFPLSVGGAGSQIVLAGRPAGAEAYVGMHEEQLFVQGTVEGKGDGTTVLHNGVPIRGSTWLRSGDVINLGTARLRLTQRADQWSVEVEEGSVGNITAPPIITPSARVHGETDSEAEPIATVQFRASSSAPTRRAFTVSPLRIVGGLVGLVALAVLWFIFTAQSIGISTDPAAAKVTVSGGFPIVPLGGRMLLRAGDYQLHAALAGYSPATQQVKVTDVPNQQFAVSLTKLPGHVRVDVPAAARVTIDGKDRGAAPASFELAPGHHTIAVAVERYQPFAGDIDVEGLGKEQVFAPKLVPNWADVKVTSEPAGAQLLVDGVVQGTTPLTAQIVAGSHPIELRLDGFKPWTTDIQVKANEPTSLGPVKLGLPDGRLSLRSDPAGAAVSVGGVYRGQTPLSLELRPDIAHLVVLSKPGYEAITREVKLGAGEDRALAVPLSGVFGEISVRAQPADAQVFVDGKPSGGVNQTLRLVATTHDVEIRRAGYVDFKTSVTPRPGLTQVIETTLLTPEATRLAATPAAVKTKSDVQLKLMPIGRFTMGSPRREPGRRANEAQRDIEFKRAFYMGVNEITNAQFKKFKTEHRSGIAGNNTLDLDNQPVVLVTWQEAALFCNWLSEQEGLPPAYEKKGEALVSANPMTKGYRLPTDAEWEWIARFETPTKFRRYPWGDSLPLATRSGNYADLTARLVVQDIVPDYDDGYAATAPVGKFPPNPLGLNDIGGNVAEWVNDYYAVSIDALTTAVDPLGPTDGKQHVIRGSSWKQSSVTDLRLSARDFGDNQRNDVGFRVARYVE